MKPQSKTMSMVEAVVNTAVGLVVAMLATAAICKSYGIPMSWENNVIITFWMTVISVVRSYVLRRLFNWWDNTWFKGATAYEWQIGPMYGRITHLRGDHWKWKPWRRFAIRWDDNWQPADTAFWRFIDRMSCWYGRSGRGAPILHSPPPCAGCSRCMKQDALRAKFDEESA